jgi:hypothetical protein|tara:strand:- start:39 stop:212 length:174 start_codon:yes stop_codon:yes gene_type:complete
MSLGNHIKELKIKHKSLKNEIVSAQNNLSINYENIILLKKLKLKLKEKIYRLEEKYN